MGLIFKRRRLKKRMLFAMVLLYGLLLMTSHVIRRQQPDPWPLPDGMRAIRVDQYDGRRHPLHPLRMAYRDTHAGAGPDTPVIVLVHGSPAPASAVFTDFAQQLSAYGRVLVPDLPGFGFSSRKIPNYGFKAHADYLLQFIDRLGIDSVHLVAYSMGGGAAIRMAVEQKARVASLSLINSLGVQELELLGDYHLNHMLHGTQLVFIRALQELIPHMGYLDRFFINHAYARNFYDADQRPLRGMLKKIRQPTLILHGEQDHFVLPGVAREHARLVPQSELKLMDGGHLMIFRQTRETVPVVGEFLSKTFAGNGLSRPDADAQRRRLADDPEAAIRMTPARGYLLVTYIMMIALATFVSEDLACIGAGLLAARGVIGLGAAVFASFAGIVIGDLLLFAAGRYVGRAVVSRVPLKWFVKPEDLEMAAGWFNAKGPGIIIASRFLPGSRLPTYVTAGVLGASPLVFLFYFSIAALLWTPALVGLSTLLGHQLLDYYPVFSRYALWMVFGLVAMLYAITHIAIPMFTFRGRRLLLAKYRKWRHWQYWPSCIICLPPWGYMLWLGLRRGHLTLFTAANPGMPASDTAGASPGAILDQLKTSGAVADYQRLSSHMTLADRLKSIDVFMHRRGVGFPVVLKPDAGRVAMGSKLIHGPDQLRAGLEQAPCDTIVQRYVPGRQFSVFYYRYPHQRQGRILSIITKPSLFLTGDGHSTLETLILKDERAVCQARMHFREHRTRLYDVPPHGEQIELSSAGPHARGAAFKDASQLAAEALVRAMDRVSQPVNGFYFGRFVFRVSSKGAFQQGRDLSIVALRPIPAGAAPVFPSSKGLCGAWSFLMRQGRIAVEIGKINHDNGAPTLSVFSLLKSAVLRKTETVRQKPDDVHSGVAGGSR